MIYADLALLLQPEPSRMSADALKFAVITLSFLILIVVALFYILKWARPKVDSSAGQRVREEFEKSKDALLMAAAARRAGHESDEATRRDAEAEAKERELLRENVDPQRVIGLTCPLCGLEMMDDQELVIDPNTGQGYHFSSFLNDWPVGAERPKYIYRYPQGTVLKSSDLIRNM